MAFTFDTTLRSARADAITTRLGSGSKLQIYAGSAGVYTTLLAEWSWSAAAFPAASSGVLTASTPTSSGGATATPGNAGTAGIARHTLSNGTTSVITDLTVGTSGANVNLSNLTVATTSPITLNSYTITEAT